MRLMYKSTVIVYSRRPGHYHQEDFFAFSAAAAAAASSCARTCRSLRSASRCSCNCFLRSITSATRIIPSFSTLRRYWHASYARMLEPTNDATAQLQDFETEPNGGQRRVGVVVRWWWEPPKMKRTPPKAKPVAIPHRFASRKQGLVWAVLKSSTRIRLAAAARAGRARGGKLLGGCAVGASR